MVEVEVMKKKSKGTSPIFLDEAPPESAHVVYTRSR